MNPVWDEGSGSEQIVNLLPPARSSSYALAVTQIVFRHKVNPSLVVRAATVEGEYSK